ncbi:hypothetical protein DL96DRAFT_789615 [Flagelloscypha sp. PMI_526]|nr:hypothetical protein DL96DRAFT_789615 [Flagelloscypha sp. PMI_526]
MHAFSSVLTLAALVTARPVTLRAESSYSGGDITYYDGGPSACGPNIDTNSDKTVAVSTHVYNSFPGATSNPNNNPICKKKVKATVNGRTQILLVQDMCEGCKDADLDLTMAAWDGFGVPRSAGRVGGLEWEFVGAPKKHRGAYDDSGDSITTFPSDDTAHDIMISAITVATITGLLALDDTSDSSGSGNKSTAASITSQDNAKFTTAVADTNDISACSDVWTACNANIPDSQEDAASDNYQTEYVHCVNDKSLLRQRSTELAQHIPSLDPDSSHSQSDSISLYY